ncbi:hypothetical protein BEL04_06790 [Mucilaginibacter sp. PPCGB 2223]|uniref:hypothetical protein n=1 Tax=Mucilaginibacter sp. PPCGB 2223 TaxID=1886027 RepID=UPI000825D742|nr:hypothetical protein [Mucilaginibacter sp. PPCGB 2223]OCX53977.1 hypothetical protein BEL04_06790 [Mucilaginibacter sp. PPCGB 2223]
MKFTPTKFFKYKNPPFLALVVVMFGLFCSSSAYGQIDYSYGVSKKGFRVGVGLGASQLQSNWSKTSIGPAGILYLDYDLSPYFTIGLDGSFGQLTGTDAENKLYFTKTSVVFAGGSLTFKIALGQFADFKSKNGFQDAMKRLYVGVGIGEVYSNFTLTPHTDGKGLPSLVVSGLAYGKIPPGTKQKSNGTFAGNITVTQIPVSFGTNIALRGFLGNDKVELNPNLQYVFVQSPYFDGYQPNSQPDPNNPLIGVNGNQAYFVGSLTLRFKF